MTVEDAWKKLQKYEAITENIERKSGRIPESLAQEVFGGTNRLRDCEG